MINNMVDQCFRARYHGLRWRLRMYISATALFFFAAALPRCDAQSMVIESESVLNLRNFVGNSIPVDTIPSDLTPAIRATGLKLAMPTPPNWCIEMPLNQLIEAMNASGIPACLHESAVDNNLDPETRVRMALHNASLEENLHFLLDTFECDFTIGNSGRITIASDDYLVENPITATFDITIIPADPDDIMELIEETVDPDSWEANGGNGRMRCIKSGPRSLLTITTTWTNMARTRRLMASVQAMSRAGDVSLNSFRELVPGGSTVVELPEYLKPHHLRYERGFGQGDWGYGQGAGGSGMGGGIF